MRLKIGSECHLLGEEVAQGGASTSFSPLCSEGGLQIQIKAHTNTVQRKYKLTHIHTDHTNTQIHKYTGSSGEEVAQGGASTSQPASLHHCAEELPDHTNANTKLTQIHTLLVYTSNDPSFFSHNIFALRQSDHLPWKSWQRVICCTAVH